MDVSSRSLISLIEPGSCFSGTLLELALASDRTYMLDGAFEDSELPAATIRLTPLNFGPLPMVNGLGRLESRYLSDPRRFEELKKSTGQKVSGLQFTAAEAVAAGLVTFVPDDLDWEDEVRLAIEERASFSPDALTGMEASLRFGGPVRPCTFQTGIGLPPFDRRPIFTPESRRPRGGAANHGN